MPQTTQNQTQSTPTQVTQTSGAQGNNSNSVGIVNSSLTDAIDMMQGSQSFAMQNWLGETASQGHWTQYSSQNSGN
jgi:hypothetical protein